MAAAEARPERLGAAHASFRHRVQAFTASFGSYPVRSVEDLRGLFEAAGFVVEELSLLPGGQPGGTGPTEPGLPFFAVNARRPSSRLQAKENGRATRRARVCSYVLILVVALSLTNKPQSI